MPSVVEVDGTIFLRTDAPDNIALWTAELPGSAPRSVSMLIEPAGPPSQAALAAAGIVVREIDALIAAAERYLVAELTSPEWELDHADRQLLERPDLPFDVPAVVIWTDGEWMIRFAECALAMGEEYGIGVLFDRRTPIAVEDLSEADDLEDTHRV